MMIGVHRPSSTRKLKTHTMMRMMTSSTGHNHITTSSTSNDINHNINIANTTANNIYLFITKDS